MFSFTATHGVEFGEETAGARGKPGPYVAWAKFERARDLDTPDGEKRYSFSTDDADVAARLRACSDYGITEVVAEPTKAPAAPAVAE